MKKYRVELCYTNFLSIDVEADSKEQAEAKAFDDLYAMNGDEDKEWSLHNTEELK